MPSRPTIEILDEAALAARAAAVIVSTLQHAIDRHGGAVLVPSAGRTPTRTYQALRERYRDALAWRRVHVLQMDEYRGLAPDDPRSLARYLMDELVQPLRVGGFTHFNDRAGRLLRPLDAYADAAGTIDLAVHGIGRNGHVGFNEPGSPIDSKVRSVRLAPSTLRANFATDADRQRCREGLTLGLAPLRAARNSLLLAIGIEKAAAMRRALNLPPSNRCPASRLRGCPNLLVLADTAAASLLAIPPQRAERSAHPARTRHRADPLAGLG
jgi:glucosamine-6-phosphate deaminase